MRLQNVEITPDCLRCIGIGQRISPFDDFDEALASPTADRSMLFGVFSPRHPYHSRTDHGLYITVYNMYTERIERCASTPFVSSGLLNCTSETLCPPHSARSISVARRSEHSGLALITFRDKVI